LTMLPESSASDRTLVERLKQRDPRALAELYDRYGKAVYVQMRSATASRAAAEDLVQETFSRAWNRVASFEGDVPLERWLLSLAPEPAMQPAAAAEASTPSPKLRRRILASAGYAPFGWAPFLAGALLLALSGAYYYSGRERTFALEVVTLRQQLGQQNVTITRFQEALSILRAPDLKQTPFLSAAAVGKVFVSPRQGILLIGSNLTPAPSGKTYQMWWIGNSGRPVPAGLFQARPDGTMWHVDHQPNDATSLAVTLEPEGGASAPSAPALFTVPLH
jgi:hypothetical protein